MNGLDIFIGVSSLGDGFNIALTRINSSPQVSLTVLTPVVDKDDKYIAVPSTTTFLDKETALRLAGAIRLAAEQIGSD